MKFLCIILIYYNGMTYFFIDINQIQERGLPLTNQQLIATVTMMPVTATLLQEILEVPVRTHRLGVGEPGRACTCLWEIKER